MASRIQRSGSALHEKYHSNFIHSRRWFIKSVHVALFPYNTLAITPLFLKSAPNSLPQVVHHFCDVGAVRYAFCMSAVIAFKLFNDAYVRANLTVSLETNPAHVLPYGSDVLHPRGSCKSRIHLNTSNYIELHAVVYLNSILHP